ncbi:MAG: HRDC domain-containing protein, partial [Chloroflexota bacterium]|nr:HRDC domain-containing protein [Chloroflexota bacterium]
CLVQISTLEHLYLVDPLDGCDPLGLVPLLTDPDVEVVVHAGKQDMQLFHELSGCIPRRIFDVQHAAAFAGYGAAMPYGRLVEETLGVRLEKGEAYSDWSRRPLTDSQLRYAADDVRYLLPMAARLREQLKALGRLDWVEEEMQQYEQAAAYGADQDDLWRKVAGHGTLSERQTAILRELALWRDETAAKRNLPRAWLVKDPTLIEIARHSPSSIDALKAIRGIDLREAERSGPAILSAIERGRQAKPIAAPHRPSRIDQARTRMLSSLADTVVRARAEQSGIASEMIATRGEVEALLLDFLSGKMQDANHRLLTGWRRELAGEAVLAVARGEIAIRALDKPPFVEELRMKNEE